MKKIVLLGDSIRMGYDKYVKNALEGVAQVYYPSDNCRFAQYLLRFVHDWKRTGGWPDDVDLVHWNAGLWDVIELFGDEPITALEYYTQVIPRVDKRLRLLFPKAKIVFATSTAVREEEYPSYAIRKNTTIQEYNRAAMEALANTDTVFNDLFEITEKIPKEYCSDMTHFNTPKGAEYLGGKVLSVICRELDIAPSDVKLENFELEKYSAENIGY